MSSVTATPRSTPQMRHIQARLSKGHSKGPTILRFHRHVLHGRMAAHAKLHASLKAQYLAREDCGTCRAACCACEAPPTCFACAVCVTFKAACIVMPNQASLNRWALARAQAMCFEEARDEHKRVKAGSSQSFFTFIFGDCGKSPVVDALRVSRMHGNLAITLQNAFEHHECSKHASKVSDISCCLLCSARSSLGNVCRMHEHAISAHG
jgi:hypothetical protein